MTDDEAKELGLMVLAWEGFRWMPGMLGRRFSRTERVTMRWSAHIGSGGGDSWPDLRDGATRGALLELLREWHGEMTLVAVPEQPKDGYTVWLWSDARLRGEKVPAKPSEPEAYAALCEIPRGEL